MKSLYLIGLILLALSAARAQKTAPQRSTLSGVYSAEQATRGSDLYAGRCKSCHAAASHTGVTFEKLWSGHSLADLFGFISTQMPKNEPGSLAPEEYADVLAYILKLNDMPTGSSELEPDTILLKAIRIETHAVSSKPEHR
jgi:mono/diheme cytochrome c family protein